MSLSLSLSPRSISSSPEFLLLAAGVEEPGSVPLLEINTTELALLFLLGGAGGTGVLPSWLEVEVVEEDSKQTEVRHVHCQTKLPVGGNDMALLSSSLDEHDVDGDEGSHDHLHQLDGCDHWGEWLREGLVPRDGEKVVKVHDTVDGEIHGDEP